MSYIQQVPYLSEMLDPLALSRKQIETKLKIDMIKPFLTDILSKVRDKDDFAVAKRSIGEKILIEAREIPLEDLAFHVMLSKAPAEYTKTVPQHIRAAKQLENADKIKKGEIISYVKITSKIGVKPTQLAKASEIDNNKYMEFMESTLDQITSSLGIDFDEILGKPKQTGIEDFFY